MYFFEVGYRYRKFSQAWVTESQIVQARDAVYAIQKAHLGAIQLRDFDQIMFLKVIPQEPVDEVKTVEDLIDYPALDISS